MYIDKIHLFSVHYFIFKNYVQATKSHLKKNKLLLIDYPLSR